MDYEQSVDRVRSLEVLSLGLAVVSQGARARKDIKLRGARG